MESRLFIDSRSADTPRGPGFAEFSCALRPPLQLQLGTADFYASLFYLQYDMRYCQLPDTVTVQFGENREYVDALGNDRIQIVWDDKIESIVLHCSSVLGLMAQMNEWLETLEDTCKIVGAETDDETWINIVPGDKHVRLSWNVCYTFGFKKDFFRSDITHANASEPTLEFWAPGPIFCRLDCLEEGGINITGSETQILGQTVFQTYRSTYLQMVEQVRSGTTVQNGLVAFTPMRPFWTRMAKEELNRVTLSLTDAQGRLLKTTPNRFYLCAEVAIKRRLTLQFE